MHKIFDSIEHYYTVPEKGRAYIRRMVDTIIELSEHNDPGIVANRKAARVLDNGNGGKERAEDIEFNEADIQKAMKILGMPRKEAIKRLKSTTTIEAQSFPDDQMIFPEQTQIQGREADIDDMELIVPIATEAVYGYKEGFCENKCTLRGPMIEQLGQDVFSGPDRPRCYECYQTYFIRMLDALVQGKPYSEIPGFIDLLNASRKKLQTELRIKSVPDKSRFRQKLEEVVIFTVDDPFLLGAIRGAPSQFFKSTFSDFLHSLIGNDLINFLQAGKGEKLKKCEWCGEYFEAKKVDRRIKFCPKCSPKCKMTKEEQHQSQKKHREQKKKHKKSLKEEMINTYMEKWGLTREEAEEQWRQDKNT